MSAPRQGRFPSFSIGGCWGDTQIWNTPAMDRGQSMIITWPRSRTCVRLPDQLIEALLVG